MATIKDIARISGYSIGTVSRVINNHPDVSDKTRKIIMEVIESEHFEPNTNAQFLKQTRQSSIVIYVKGIGNIFLENILEKINYELKKYDEEPDVIFVDESNDEMQMAVKYQSERNPKGIIFLGGGGENFQAGINQLHTPCVLTAAYCSNKTQKMLSSFYTDDYEGASAIGKMLIEKRHRNIGIIAGYFSIHKNTGEIVSPRVKGTIDQLKKNNIAFNIKKQLIECRFDMEDAYNATMALISKYPKCTAIFAHSDTMAIGVIRALKDLGYNVPNDISVVGYDGIELTQFINPRITTIRQDTDLLAEKTVNDILNRISNPGIKGTVESIPLQIIEAESLIEYKKKS